MRRCRRLSSHSTRQIILVGENNEGILLDYNFRNVRLVPRGSSKSYVLENSEQKALLNQLNAPGKNVAFGATG